MNRDTEETFDGHTIEMLRAIPAKVGALTPDEYVKAWGRAAHIKDAHGALIGNVPDLLVVPPQLRYVGSSIVEAAFLVDTISVCPNPARGTADLRTVQALADQPRRWYVVGTNGVEAMECPA